MDTTEEPDDLETRLKRAQEEMKWCRLVDLPGYDEWSKDYVGLERIIPGLEDFHLHVHRDEFAGSLARKIEETFEAYINDWNERVSSYGLEPHTLADYKIGGKFGDYKPIKKPWWKFW